MIPRLVSITEEMVSSLLWPEGDSLIHYGDCCKSLDTQVLLKGSQEKKIEGYEFRTVGRVAQNLQHTSQ
jgi:hypothetical protein